jgi:hypothetical protein
MIQEFHYNWFIVQRIITDITNNQAPPEPALALAPQVPPGPPVLLHTPPSSSSSNSLTSTPHSSPTPSTSGTRPKGLQPPTSAAFTARRDPSGASTSRTKTTPQPSTSTQGSTCNLRQLEKVDNKELHTRKQQFLKRCPSTKDSVRKKVKKSMAKVHKVTDMFPPISQNSSSSSTAQFTLT